MPKHRGRGIGDFSWVFSFTALAAIVIKNFLIPGWFYNNCFVVADFRDLLLDDYIGDDGIIIIIERIRMIREFFVR